MSPCFFNIQNFYGTLLKMEKGLQPGKFSLTAVLLTFSDLSHSRQTKTLSSGHIHYCCF